MVSDLFCCYSFSCLSKGAKSSKQWEYQSYTHHLFHVQCSGHEKQFLECKYETSSNSICQTTVTVYCQRCELHSFNWT